MHDTIYTDQVQFVVLVEADVAEQFEQQMTDILKGKQATEKTDVLFGVWQSGSLSLLEA